MNTRPAPQWTAPEYGVSHLYSPSRKYRASIDAAAEVRLWSPGCGFNPILESHPTFDGAKARAESWIASQP